MTPTEQDKEIREKLLDYLAPHGETISEGVDTQHTIKLGSVVKWREVRDLLDAAISKHKGEKTKWEN